HVEHDDGVLVLQPRGDPAFPHGALPGLFGFFRSSPGLQQQLLDRDRAVQAFVDGTPHHSHGAAADPFLQAVPARDQLTFGAHRYLLVMAVPVATGLTGPPWSAFT